MAAAPITTQVRIPTFHTHTLAEAREIMVQEATVEWQTTAEAVEDDCDELEAIALVIITAAREIAKRALRLDGYARDGLADPAKLARLLAEAVEGPFSADAYRVIVAAVREARS